MNERHVLLNPLKIVDIFSLTYIENNFMWDIHHFEDGIINTCKYTPRVTFVLLRLEFKSFVEIAKHAYVVNNFINHHLVISRFQEQI
jgi:hypothetical protein